MSLSSISPARSFYKPRLRDRNKAIWKETIINEKNYKNIKNKTFIYKYLYQTFNTKEYLNTNRGLDIIVDTSFQIHIGFMSVNHSFTNVSRTGNERK